MKKKKEKTKDVLARALAASSQEEAEAILKEAYSTPINNYFQFFIGGENNVEKNKQEGKPHPPY